jgi:alkylated DNA repair dioxygenase AlkB
MTIDGLNYVPNFIDAPTQAALIDEIDGQTWWTDLQRRVQHYGYKYDYKARKIDRSMHLGALPIWAQLLATKLIDEGYVPDLPDQLIVNEYEPGQGISAHVDCVSCFGSIVCSVTLGSGCAMDFTKVAGVQKQSLFLECGSLLVLNGAARYDWKHAIPARKSDKIGELSLPRSRRVSLTFRTVIL